MELLKILSSLNPVLMINVKIKWECFVRTKFYSSNPWHYFYLIERWICIFQIKESDDGDWKLNISDIKYKPGGHSLYDFSY